MIPIILFSCDRPAQLDIALSSIEQNDNDLFYPISIVVKITNDEFEKGYKKVTEYHKNFQYYREDFWDGDFRKTLFYLLNQYYFDKEIKYLSFFVDDNILFKKIDFSLNDIDDLFDHGIDTLSLRLGQNTYLEDPYNNRRSILPKKFHHHNGFYIWDSMSVPDFGDFGYPISLDGNIFDAQRIIDLFSSLEFSSPNYLEGNAANHRDKFRSMACRTHSYVVNSPNTRVQSLFNNRFGEKYPLDIKELNEKFLQGYRFSLKKIDFSNIVGAHMELDLVMEK